MIERRLDVTVIKMGRKIDIDHLEDKLLCLHEFYELLLGINEVIKHAGDISYLMKSFCTILVDSVIPLNVTDLKVVSTGLLAIDKHAERAERCFMFVYHNDYIQAILTT